MKPWIWVASGIALAALELVVPSFTIIWFGLAAIVTGIISFLFGIQSLAAQLALWAFLSGLFTFMWFKFFRQETRTFSGQGKDAVIGKTGTIVRVTDSTFPGGVIRFPIAIMGSDEWSFISEDEFHVGDRGMITDVAGDKLIIKKS